MTVTKVFLDFLKEVNIGFFFLYKIIKQKSSF